LGVLVAQFCHEIYHSELTLAFLIYELPVYVDSALCTLYRDVGQTGLQWTVMW